MIVESHLNYIFVGLLLQVLKSIQQTQTKLLSDVLKQSFYFFFIL